MSEFNIEQLKTVLDNMTSSLDETSGDKGTRDVLDQIKNLLQEIKKQATSGGKSDSAKDKDFIKSFFEEWDRQNPLRDLRKSVDSLSKDSDNPLRQTGKGSGGGDGKDKDNNNSGGGINPLKALGAAKNASKFTKALGSATAIMSDLAAGGSLIVNFMKSNANSYRSMIGSGEGSINNIMDMRNTASTNGMSVEQLVAATEKSSGVRMGGAKEFAGIQKSIRDFGVHTGNFGMTVQQLQDATGDYMTMAQNQGILNGASAGDMSSRIEKLIVINQDMAAMTGKTREEARQAAMEASRDPNFNAAMTAAGLSPQTISAMTTQLGNLPATMGGQLRELFTGHGSPLTDSVATAMANSPALQEAGRRMKEARDKGAELQPEEVMSIIKDYTRGLQKETKTSGAVQDIAAIRTAQGDSRFSGFLGAQQDARTMNPDKLGRVKPDGTTGDGSDFTKAALKIDEVETRAAAAMDSIFNKLIEPSTVRFGKNLNNAADMALAFTNKMQNGATWLDKHPNVATAGAGAAGIAALLGMNAVGGIAKKGIKGLGSMFRGGGGAAAEAGAAEAGAAEAGVAAEGVAGVGAGAAMLPLGMVAAGGLGMYYGHNKLAEGGTSWSDKLKGYGSSIAGGAAIGGAAGLAGLGVGAIPGALIGGAVGLGSAVYSDWNSPDPAANASRMPRANIPQGFTGNPPAANASGANNTPANMMMRLETKLLEVQTSSLNQLVEIKKSNQMQIDLMRQELAAHKVSSDRVAALLEQSNKNTKMIQGLA